MEPAPGGRKNRTTYSPESVPSESTLSESCGSGDGGGSESTVAPHCAGNRDTRRDPWEGAESELEAVEHAASNGTTPAKQTCTDLSKMAELRSGTRARSSAREIDAEAGTEAFPKHTGGALKSVTVSLPGPRRDSAAESVSAPSARSVVGFNQEVRASSQPHTPRPLTGMIGTPVIVVR